MNPNELVENAGRLADTRKLTTNFSPVQREAIREAGMVRGGWLKLGTGLNYEVNNEPTTTYLNRANVRSLTKAGVVEPVTRMDGRRVIVTGMRLTRLGYQVADTIGE
jgi:hypothetical protein